MVINAQQSSISEHLREPRDNSINELIAQSYSGFNKFAVLYLGKRHKRKCLDGIFCNINPL